MFPRPPFFQGAKINFAENLLYPSCNPSEHSLAIIAATEETRERLTWKQLRERVSRCTAAMKALGIKEGDRIAAYVSNHASAVVAMLSTTSIGAIWTAVSPDTGVQAVLDRVQQIEPVLLFADNAVMYNGKIHNVHDKLQQIVRELPQLQATVVFETISAYDFNFDDIMLSDGTACCMYQDFIRSAEAEAEPYFAQLPPDHPVYILYSSGTTGKPKCITHGCIGTLIQHKKEHELQCDIHVGDRLFYFTTCTCETIFSHLYYILQTTVLSGAPLL